MTPNQITCARVVAAFAAVGFFVWAGGSVAADLGALALIVAAIALDGLDGYLARRKNLATALGAQFDILGDRIVENLLFTFFATGGLVTLWVPVFFFVRGTITDFFRSVAARSGRSGFGGMECTRRGGAVRWWRRGEPRPPTLRLSVFAFVISASSGRSRMFPRFQLSPRAPMNGSLSALTCSSARP